MKLPLKTLLVHGWASDATVWRAQTEAIDGVVGVTLPGFSQGSSVAASTWDEPTLKGAAKEVLDCAGGERCAAIGWSLGGEVLIEAAADTPGAFTALVLVSTTPSFVKREGFPWAQSKALVRRMLMDVKAKPRETLDRFYSLNFTEMENESAGAGRLISSLRESFDFFDRTSLATSLEALMMTDLRSTLSAIECPVLVVHGTDDMVCPSGAGRYLKENISGAELMEFSGAGHAPFVTQSSRFNKAVTEFLLNTL